MGTSETADATKSILVVDDEKNVRVTLAANLELAGYRVVEASDGEEAVECVAKDAYDLVIMDIRMPRTNGVEALKRMRQLRPGVQVLLITGFAVEELVKEGVRGGAFTVVHKPIAVTELLSVVSLAIRHPLVMIVDDVEGFALALQASLEEAGLRARTTLTGAEALAAAQSGDVDVCVLDLALPDIPGTELCTRLPELAQPMAIIAITGTDDAVLIRDALTRGADACLRKPFPIDQLLEAISAARRRIGARAAE